MDGGLMAAAASRLLSTGLGMLLLGCTTMAVDARTLAGTRWLVTSLNGQPTPGGSNFEMRFEADRMSARFGCNTASGAYAISGDTLQPVGPQAATQMACASAF